VRRWIIATRSHGKLLELMPMLASHGIVGIGLDDAGVPESDDEQQIEVYATFEENAVAKARYFSARTGLPCLADDSGLCIDALDGAPGVRSRRFGADRGLFASLARDEDTSNNEAMLEACRDSGRAPPWRAGYACVACYSDATQTVSARGETEGAIHPERSGTGGFGYDPYFVSADLGVSFATASRDDKARVSHRARAVATLLAALAHDPSTVADR
jgi:XTP/dITP diphosphohydrolase